MKLATRGRRQRPSASYPFDQQNAAVWLKSCLGQETAERLLAAAANGKRLAGYIRQSLEIRRTAKTLAALVKRRGASIPPPWSKEATAARFTRTTAALTRLFSEPDLMREAHVRAAVIHQLIAVLGRDDWTSRLPDEVRRALGDDFIAALAAASIVAIALSIRLTHAQVLGLAVASGVEAKIRDEDAFLRRQDAVRKHARAVRCGVRFLLALRRPQGWRFRVEK